MLEAGQSTSTWAWQSWAPNWTNFTVGNGTVVAKYIQIGKTVHFKIKVTLGSTSSVSGAITFSLPTDSHADYGTSGFNIGVSRMNDTGTSSYPGEVTILTASTAKIFPTVAGGTYTSNSDTSSTVPYTWVATDIFTAVGTYEAT
ncbi:hypothetical protein COZ22_01795 [bacterium (Candidatus Howlettbacteria) CG_4_10_14_3_um_filter_37_10]|nr:MAG: hypothetical protein COX25_03120 [bacterium (Candidatus Howlettbacteria) CG23_combo_of_CG06-09_8_20_14_all_37_9]PIX99758.1 MAG: hypothetical protein COZ22_01795 [bacterium (Candidatus Howlettbacteria) CG_4_10_14_3_um_filter_37_10]PJB06673.1 MAG: hypothetical protein CO123_01625 [bacterium (Candidatus Howlettbacteria) CG_4_9_14_3_um_filter_37_10]